MATYPDSLLILNGKSASNDLLRQAMVDLREDGARIHVRSRGKKATRHGISMKASVGRQHHYFRRRRRHHQ
jgi:hypothetical protein